MKRIVLVQKVQDNCHGTLTPTATLIFENIKRQAGDYVVTWNGGDMYQCNGPWDEQVVVNMRTRECACRRWELTGIPCKHAVASLWNMSLNGTSIGLLEDWVHPCYRLDTWKEAYSFKIQPTNGSTMWPRSECPTRLLPPLYHTPIGRPKKKRNACANEVPLVSGNKLSRRGKNVTCAKCGNPGHNRATCKGEGGQSSQSQNQSQSQSHSQSQSQSKTGVGVGQAGSQTVQGRGRGAGQSRQRRGRSASQSGQGGRAGQSDRGVVQPGSQSGKGRGSGAGQSRQRRGRSASQSGQGGRAGQTRKAFGGWI